MFHINKSAEFPYSPEQLFALMSDIRNEEKWLPGVNDVRKLGDHPLGAGTVFEARGVLRLFQPVLKWMFDREFSKRPGQILHGLEIFYPR